MRQLSLAAVLVAGVSVAGCVSTQATVLDHTMVRTEVDPTTVRIYRTAESVPGSYEEVALLNSRGDSLMTNERGMMESMRTKAAKLGANAIVLDAMSESAAVVQIAARLMDQRTDRRSKALAIYVQPNNPSVAAPRAHVTVPVTTPAVQPVVIAQQQQPKLRAFTDDGNGLASTPPATKTAQQSVCLRDPQTGEFTRCQTVTGR
jgi:hypothetical protein